VIEGRPRVVAAPVLPTVWGCLKEDGPDGGLGLGPCVEERSDGDEEGKESDPAGRVPLSSGSSVSSVMRGVLGKEPEVGEDRESAGD
jgi:hypothetical protein